MEVDKIQCSNFCQEHLKSQVVNLGYIAWCFKYNLQVNLIARFYDVAREIKNFSVYLVLIQNFPGF